MKSTDGSGGPTICAYCRQRIVRVNYSMGPEWVHQPEGAAFADGQYTFCRITVATPVDITEGVQS